MRRVLLTWSVLAVLCACGDGDSPATDAAGMPGDALALPDARRMTDGSPALSWVDFAVSGCAAGQPGVPPEMPPDQPADSDAGPADAGPGGDAGMARPTCRGAAPLTLHFTAVAPAPIEVHVWSFGDDTTDSVSAPVHVFELPGTYDVTLTVRGPGGTASITQQAAVEVLPADLGSACGADEQCGADRDCACAGDTACPAGLTRGMCTSACSAASPCGQGGQDGVCADLAAASPQAPSDWQRALCLAPCGPDRTCPQGLTCQDLPAAHAADDADGDGWVQGCFVPGILAPMGASCLDANGVPNHQACAGGLCLAVGARGMCSALCTPGTCPPSAACADLGVVSACLSRCEDVTKDCQEDPWLTCEPPGKPGGFEVDEPDRGAGYCATRSCTEPAQCGSDGTCQAGYCTAR